MIAACNPRQWLTLSRVALLATAALMTTACVDERAFFITGNSSECSSSTATGAQLAGGVLDISVPDYYYFFPEVRNEMLSTKGQDGEPERNNLTIEGFEIDLELPSGSGVTDPALTKTFSYASGLVEPGGGTASFSYVPIISRELVQQLALPTGQEAVVVAKIRARASHNGSTLKSVEFNFPIRLCNGCLVTDLGDCPSTKPAGVSTNTCGLPQDAPVVCCTEATSGNKTCLDQAQLSALPEDTGV